MEKEFNVITYNINSKKFESYNIIPYLLSCYNKKKDKPKTFNEFKEFIKGESMYQWWSRCEYEIILSPWPYTTSPSERYDKKGENDIEAWKEHWKKHLQECEKIDVHDQVMMNLDIITQIFIECVKMSKDYEQGWEDGVRECLELAESIDDNYMAARLKEWLGYD